MRTSDAGSLPVADGEGVLDFFGVVPAGVLAVVAIVAFLAVVLGIVAGWLALRKLRRSPLAGRGRELARSGVFSVGALALPPGRRELAALGTRVTGARNELARQLEAAAAAGRDIGNADVLGPRLVAEGDRLAAELRRLTLSGDAAAAGAQARSLTDQGEDYTRRVRPLLDVLRTTASSISTAPVTSDEIDDAVAGLRARDDAYRQFMNPTASTSPPTPAPGRTADDAATPTDGA